MANTAILLTMVVILVIIFVALIFALIYANKALVSIKNYDGWDSDPNLADAVKYLTWTVTLAWITLALIIIGGFFLIFYSFEAVTSALHWIVAGLLFLTIVSAIIVGIVTAIAAKKIGDSGLKDTSDDIQQAYQYCVYAAVIALVAVALLIIAMVVYYVYRYQKGKSEKAKAAVTIKAETAVTTPAAPVPPAAETHPQPIVISA